MNFSDKTLSGKLYKNGYVTSNNPKQDITERYSITATLNGNRFSGKAVSLNPEDPYFGADSNTVEGGFYGENAEELAGKFIADDNSLFAVFAAKQKEIPAKTSIAFDAAKINLKNFNLEKNDTFGNATKLVVDGHQISLLPENASENKFRRQFSTKLQDKDINIDVCCSNLDWVKYGSYHFNNEDFLFINGERTSPTDMAKLSGSLHYRGSWRADIMAATGETFNIFRVIKRHRVRLISMWI